MNIKIITKENALIQRLMALRHNRNKRYHNQEFIIEGCQALDAALEINWPIKSVYFKKTTKLSQWTENYLNQSTCNNMYEITPDIMKKISDKTESPEIIAVGVTKHEKFNLNSFSNTDLALILDQPKSANNLGTIIRSAVVFGVKAIIISGHAADLYDPKCIRASVGTFFKIPIYFVTGVNEFTESLTHLNYPYTLITTGEKGSQQLSKFNFPNILSFLILGNETKGVSKGYRDIAKHFVCIPTTNTHTSLNVGSAASILLYEYFRQQNNC